MLGTLLKHSIKVQIGCHDKKIQNQVKNLKHKQMVRKLEL
jgi:hypothetical protein